MQESDIWCVVSFILQAVVGIQLFAIYVLRQMRSLNEGKRFFNVTYEEVEQMGKMPMRD